ncbi:MAG: hypothetical protein WA742_06575 [Candidatus Cybelea sp.]
MIDDHLHQPWPDELKEALARLDQGDVLEGLPSLGYFGRKSTAATKACAELQGDDSAVELIEVTPAPNAWIVVTQSCDIVEEDRPKPMFPFLLVAPVYRDGPGGDVPAFEVDNVGVSYLVRLTGPRFQGGSWVADLRYQQSIDKGLIIGATPSKGFATADEVRDFGRRLAEQATRPAFTKSIVDCIVKPLRTYFRKHENVRTAMRETASLRELRLRISADSATAELIVVLGDDGDVEVARDELANWWHTAVKKCRTSGLTLLGLKIGTLRSLNADSYAQSDRLSIEWLIPRASTKGTGSDVAETAGP